MSDIHLGRDASESTVKQISLAEYRVVYFATHGRGRRRKGPRRAFARTDASSQTKRFRRRPPHRERGGSAQAQCRLGGALRLQHHCRRQAGCGLRLARALLASHWSVESDAATQLTTRVFAIVKQIRCFRAEALRRSMLDYLNNRSEPKNAYPAFWGPFSLVGQGASRNLSRTNVISRYLMLQSTAG
jgi:CHAT domain